MVLIYNGTVKNILLLGIPPTVTTTGPFDAPEGTGTTMELVLQLVGVAMRPLKVTVLLPRVAPKLVPESITDVPTGPDGGDREERLKDNEKLTPLLAFPVTVTATGPLVTPEGAVATRDVSLQLEVVAMRPLKVTVLVP
jgi:hypothetical protein